MNAITEHTPGLLYGWWFLTMYLVIVFIQPLLYPNNKELIQKLLYHPKSNQREKFITKITMTCYFIMLLYSIFISFKLSNTWFWIGTMIYSISMLSYIISIHNYATTALNEPVVKGMYRISRNPIHFFSAIAWLGVGIALISPVILALGIITMIGMHFGTLAEERFCIEKYGDAYKQYMKTTPRYFIFF